MANLDKVLKRILSGRSDNNIPFDDLRNLLLRLGFSERVKGDHHIFTKPGVREILNLQPRQGGKAKPYQVKQVRDVLQDYGLTQLP
jgi:HicA toxin of bacterial toxin-antitoxin,